MPYDEWDEVNDAIKGIEPRVTLEQANVIADWADAMAESDDPPENPWATAIAQFEELYEVVDGEWVLKEQEEMEAQMSVTTNAVSGVVRTERVGGRDFLVAPVVALAEGVLKGALVTAEEIEKSCGTWSGRPLVVRHEKVNGRYVSVNRPEMLEKLQIGHFYPYEKACDAVSDGKLRGEAWVDIQKAQKMPEGKEVLKRLRGSVPTEVSTAYWAETNKKSGMFNGEAYQEVAKDIRPDHLAVILDGEGECNWQDGCGMPRVNEASLTHIQQTVLNAWYELVKDGAVFKIYENNLVADIDDKFVRYPYEFREGDEGEEEVIFGEPMQVEFRAIEAQERTGAVERFLRLVDRLGVFRRGKQMDERVKMILEDGRFPNATEEELEALEDDELDVLSKLVKENPLEKEAEVEMEVEPEAEPEPEALEREEEEEESPDFEAMVSKAVEKRLEVLGDLKKMQEMVANAEKKESEERDRLIKRITANERCAYSEEELRAFPNMDALRKLERVLSPTSFVGQGGMTPDENGELEMTPFEPVKKL